FAPLYANHVAHSGPNEQHPLGKVEVNGEQVDIISAGGNISTKTGKPCTFGETDCKLVASIPIGPQWFAAGGKYVLGADVLGRDVGRSSRSARRSSSRPRSRRAARHYASCSPSSCRTS